jgi:hypothetical protein
MATPLQFSDVAVAAEVALPSERDVRGSAEGGEAESQTADNELG